MDDLHVLFVEDNPVDTELAVRELQKSGFDMKWQRVDTQPDFMNRRPKILRTLLFQTMPCRNSVRVRRYSVCEKAG